MKLTSRHIVAICDALLLHSCSEHLNIHFFCTDSRKIRNPKASIFVALQTDVRDGHTFIASAYAQGVRCFLVSNKTMIPEGLDADVILVKNTLYAMQALAEHHRKQFNIPLLGITGSNGKTIVKEWLAQLLSAQVKLAKNPKSYNSQLGVALSVSQLSSEHSLGIFEAGISERNEMLRLQKMLLPTEGIFTMIGEAHGANFASETEKIREKLLLFIQSKKLFYCKDHARIDAEVHSFLLPQNKALQLITWGQHPEAALRILTIEKKETTQITARYAEQDLNITIPYTDDAHIENAMHCWLYLLASGYNPNEITPWFENLAPVHMRLESVTGINHCTLINDTYSSDFASLRIALDFLKEQRQHQKHSLILSDMDQHNEGENLPAALAGLLKEQGLYRLVLVGEALGKNKSTFEKLGIKIIEAYPNVDGLLHALDTTRYENEAILIKGARRYSLERIVNRLEKNIHRTVLSINLSALIHNVNTFKKNLRPQTKIMAMVKAFSYGSGSYEIAQALEQHGADYLAVAYVDEGIILRNKGIQLPILILNPELSSLDAMLHYKLEPELYSIPLLKQFISKIKSSDERLPIHIKLDTGMHRLGIEPKDLNVFLDEFLAANCFEVKSIFSHLVASDDPNHFEFTKKQKDLFVKMSAEIEARLGYKCLKHLSNSGGVQSKLDVEFDMVRLGIGLYGISKTELPLRQISTLSTQVSQLKILPKGETVGYGRAGLLARDTVLATLNIGYADGYARAFGQGVGKVLLHGQLAPVIGNVCMDMIMVDVTDIPLVKENDTAIVFGPELPVTELAQWIDTIPYEIMAGISQRVKRVFYQE